MKPGDRLICCLVRPLASGASFSDWPLHITIVPWFRINVVSSRLVNELSLNKFLPFKVTLGSESSLGVNKPVTLIKLPSALTEIEAVIHNYLHDKGAWLVDETTKEPHSFLPHITWQKGVKPAGGFRIAEIQLMQQTGGSKMVVAAWRVADEN
ncbi:MAG: hypothetical protein ACREGF_02195 [Candidatus Saccharimonadales bacterium]